MKKKLFLLLMIGAMGCSLIGCGNAGKTEDSLEEAEDALNDGDLDTARESDEEVLELDDENEDSLEEAENTLNDGDSDTSGESDEEVLELDDENEDAEDGMIEDLLEEAEDALDDGDLDTARECYEEVLELDAENEDAKDGLEDVEIEAVSHDTQLCHSISIAVQTAMLDPSVVDDEEYKEPADDGEPHSLESFVSSAGSGFEEYINDCLGYDYKDINSMLESTYQGETASNVMIVYENFSVTVYIDNSCADAKMGEESGTCNKIYSGPDCGNLTN